MSLIQRSTYLRRAFCVGALVLAVVALAGCGGDDDASGSAEGVQTSSLSKKQYIAKANAICSKGGAEALALASAYRPPQGETLNEAQLAVAAIQEALLPEFDEMIAEVEKLGAPSGERAEVEAVLLALERDVNSARKSLPADLAVLEKSFKRSAAQARKYGVKECAFAG